MAHHRGGDILAFFWSCRVVSSFTYDRSCRSLSILFIKLWKFYYSSSLLRACLIEFTDETMGQSSFCFWNLSVTPSVPLRDLDLARSPLKGEWVFLQSPQWPWKPDLSSLSLPSARTATMHHHCVMFVFPRAGPSHLSYQTMAIGLTVHTIHSHPFRVGGLRSDSPAFISVSPVPSPHPTPASALFLCSHLQPAVFH